MKTTTQPEEKRMRRTEGPVIPTQKAILSGENTNQILNLIKIFVRILPPTSQMNKLRQATSSTTPFEVANGNLDETHN